MTIILRFISSKKKGTIPSIKLDASISATGIDQIVLFGDRRMGNLARLCVSKASAGEMLIRREM